MKKNKQLKKLKIIIFCLILIVVISILILFNLIKSREKDNVESNYKKVNLEKEQKNAEDFFSDKIVPQGIYKFSNEYTGDVSRNQMYEQLYSISRYLPDLCSDLKINNAKSYYLDSSENIKKYLGIENETEFIRLTEFLSENDVSDLDFEYCTYHSGTMKKDVEYSTFKIDFKYKDKDALTFKIGILNTYLPNRPVLKLIFN